MTKIKQRQIDVAEIIKTKILADNPDAVVEFHRSEEAKAVYVSSVNTYKWFHFKIGNRLGIKNMHDNKPVKFMDLVPNTYRI